MATALVDAIKSRASSIVRQLVTRIFVVPGYLGTEMDREMTTLGGMHSLSEEQVMLIQGRQLEVAKEFWKSMGFSALSNSNFWLSDWSVGQNKA
jgi:hypothetical protein